MSDGRVMTAEPWRLLTVCLLVMVRSSWVLELGEQVVEAVETGVPGALERAHPVVDGLQRRPVDPVPAVPPVHADEHETDRPQHAEVLGHLRLAEAEPVDELADRCLPGAQGIEEIAPARLGDGVERIRRRRGASHDDIIFRYRNMSRSLAMGARSMVGVWLMR